MEGGRVFLQSLFQQLESKFLILWVCPFEVRQIRVEIERENIENLPLGLLDDVVGFAFERIQLVLLPLLHDVRRNFSASLPKVFAQRVLGTFQQFV